MAPPGVPTERITLLRRAFDRTMTDAQFVADAAKKQQGRYSTQVGGVYDNQTPLDAWTKLAHALFQSNEAM